MLDSLDAVALRRWCAVALEGLRRHEAEINALNVYPVRDNDTGTNLVLTLTSAWQALIGEPQDQPGGTRPGAAPPGFPGSTGS